MQRKKNKYIKRFKIKFIMNILINKGGENYNVKIFNWITNGDIIYSNACYTNVISITNYSNINGIVRCYLFNNKLKRLIIAITGLK